MRPGPCDLTRDIAILDDDTWSGTFRVSAESLCTTPTMVFRSGGPDRTVCEPAIQTAAMVDFVIAEGEIALLEADTAAYLNSTGAGQCGDDTWQVGTRQAVTRQVGTRQAVSATGCAPIGMTLPMTVHEILLERDDDIFFGARPVDGTDIARPENRPTDLEVPMVRSN